MVVFMVALLTDLVVTDLVPNMGLKLWYCHLQITQMHVVEWLW